MRARAMRQLAHGRVGAHLPLLGRSGGGGSRSSSDLGSSSMQGLGWARAVAAGGVAYGFWLDHKVSLGQRLFVTTI